MSKYDLFKKLTWAEKSKDDFKWMVDTADYARSLLPIDKENNKRIRRNLALYNGDGKDVMNHFGSYDDSLADEGFYGAYDNIKHIPVADQVAKSMYGEQIKRDIEPIARDLSDYTLNNRKKKNDKLYKQYISHNIIEPARQKIVMQMQEQQGIQDVFQLDPEQQNQFNQQVDQQLQFELPEDIDKYMANNYKAPAEKMIQDMVSVIMEYHNIKYMTDEGFKYMLSSGSEVYYRGIENGKPVIRLVNMMNFRNLNSQNNDFIEDSYICVYGEHLSLFEIQSRYPDAFDKYEELESGNSGFKEALDRAVADNSVFIKNWPSETTKEGQKVLKDFASKGGTTANGAGLHYIEHVCFRGQRLFKYLTRMNPKTKEEEHYWLSEHYEFNELKGDVEIKEVWVDEIYEVVFAEGGKALMKRPLPNQYLNTDNPFNPIMPYMGKHYFKQQGNVTPSAPLDNGAKMNYHLNVQMHRVMESQALDIGNVFLTSMHAKPKNWSYAKWLMMAKKGRILPIDLNKAGMSPADAQVFKTLNLSTIQDLGAKLEYAEWLKNQVALSMGYNPSRLGQIVPSMPVTNNQQNIIQSSYQTEELYRNHNQIVERLLRYGVIDFRAAFKKNKKMFSYMLDDMSIAYLNVNWEVLEESIPVVYINNSAKDFDSIRNLKALAHSMIQGGLMSFSDAAKLEWAKSRSQIMNIIEETERKQQEQAQREQEANQQLMQQQSELSKELEAMRHQLEMEKIRFEKEADYKETIDKAMISSEVNRKGYDVNQNNQNDLKEIKDAELKQREKESLRDYKIKKDKLKIEEKKINKN